MATSARDIMTGGTECIGEHDSIAEAARTMQKLSVGALPICGDNQRLQGMITDRDIVVKVVAQGKDPATTTAGELAQGKPVTIGADDSVDELVATMSRERVKRLPVIDGDRLVGIVTESDVAANAPQETVIDLVRNVYATA